MAFHWKAPSFFISAIIDLPASLAWRSKRLKQLQCPLSSLGGLKACDSNCSIIACVCLVPSTALCLFLFWEQQESASVPAFTSSQFVLRSHLSARRTGLSWVTEGWTLCKEVIYDDTVAVRCGACVFFSCFVSHKYLPYYPNFSKEAISLGGDT